MPSSVPFPSAGPNNPSSSPTTYSSPPSLPVPRQPSPLSFASLEADHRPSPPKLSSIAPLTETGSSDASASSRLPSLSGTYTTPLAQTASTLDSPSPPSAARAAALVPIQPLPDSLLLRSTFSALEHSANTLKRLSKGVLTAASAVQALAEQLERAEDDLFLALGELGRWLESGYNVQPPGAYESVWEPEGGIRKVHKEKRRQEREEMEVWVEHGLKAAKAELKRQGLAGGGAHTRFETTAKQFYHQTSVYLSPQQSSGGTSSAFTAPTSFPSHAQQSSVLSGSSASSSTSAAPPLSERAQSLRMTQFDLARYNHHSTLLYAIPPSSVSCLDLLVGFYSWVGGLLGETPGRHGVTDSPDLRARAATTGHRLSGLDTPVQLLSRPTQPPSPTTEAIKTTLSFSLAQLAKTRSDLLHAWAARNSQTTQLENEVNRRQGELDGNWVDNPSSPIATTQTGGNAIAPVSSTGIEHKKAKKHKIHRSVGGRLREFLTPSTSTTNLATQAQGTPGDRTSRISLDGEFDRAGFSAPPAPIRRRTWDDRNVTPTAAGVDKLPTHHEMPSASLPADAVFKTPPLPSTINEKTLPRPPLPSRHSVQMPHGVDYISPFNPSAAAGDYPLTMMPFESSPDLRRIVEQEKPRQSMDSGKPSVGGVGGLDGTGDEDERREEAGRKKEGVLWGLGSWEGLTKGGSGKGKWEKFWVVLDHSRIYEYRDNALGMPEHAHAVIDLKFASVREGRGTDRRFVFEIVTPSQGKRLYQATSETEMKLWLYAICNAIESCINGTSSVRTFDTSKLRTVSGSLDDHALPTRSKLGLGFNGRIIGLGLPMPPNGRRSMPPTPGSAIINITDGEEGKRTRKTSLKKVLKSGGEKLSSVVGVVSGSGSGGTHRYSFTGGVSGGLDVPRPAFGKAGSSRTSLPLSTYSAHSATSADSSLTSTSTSTPTPTPAPGQANENQQTPASNRSKGSSSDSWADGEIEKRVLEMAGLGLGYAPATPQSPDEGGKRRVKSEAVHLNHPDYRHVGARQDQGGAGAGDAGAGMTRSKSDDGGIGGKLDISELRKIADLPGNDRCADCGKGMRASRWATISLRETPIVMFICIRCCGIHRSLGTHISKPRSVDLDHWSPEMVELARKWGNAKGNAVWERTRREDGRVGDEAISEFIKDKYVRGKWLAQEDRHRYGVPVQGGSADAVAIGNKAL